MKTKKYDDSPRNIIVKFGCIPIKLLQTYYEKHKVDQYGINALNFSLDSTMN